MSDPQTYSRVLVLVLRSTDSTYTTLLVLLIVHVLVLVAKVLKYLRLKYGLDFRDSPTLLVEYSTVVLVVLEYSVPGSTSFN